MTMSPEGFAPLIVDENGWAKGLLTPFAVDECLSVLSPEAEARMDMPALDKRARSLWGARLQLVSPKQFPNATVPLCDAADVRVQFENRPLDEACVRMQTLPVDRAREVLFAGRRAAVEMGGAGFDVLVERTQRVWQVKAHGDASSDLACLVVAGTLAGAFLGPVLLRGQAPMFGTAGARSRIEALRTRLLAQASGSA